MSHAPPGEPVELGDVQRPDLACEKERQGIVEAAARAVLTPGDIQLLELELWKDLFVVVLGGVMAQPTLVSGENGSWAEGNAERRSNAPAGSGKEEPEGKGVAEWDAAGMGPSIERLFDTEYPRTSICTPPVPASSRPIPVSGLPALQGARRPARLSTPEDQALFASRAAPVPAVLSARLATRVPLAAPARPVSQLHRRPGSSGDPGSPPAWIAGWLGLRSTVTPQIQSI